MPSIALCPRCQGIIAVASLAEPERELRCPLCAAIFTAGELSATATSDPPLAMSVDGSTMPVETQVEPIATSPDSEAPAESVVSAESEVAVMVSVAEELTATASSGSEDQPSAATVPSMNGVHASESAGEAWTESLSAAEGATVVPDELEDAALRPYHEDPEYNSHLAVEGTNGSAWPELAAVLAAEREASATALAPAPEPAEVHQQPERWTEPASTPPSDAPVDDFMAIAESSSPEASGVGAFMQGWSEGAGTAVEEGGEYGLSGAAETGVEEGGAAPYEAPRPTRRRKAQPSMFAVLAQFLGIAVGGVIGLAIGYMILLWIKGPSTDFLQIGKSLPSWMVPSSVSGETTD
jgi:hypothetical protein